VSTSTFTVAAFVDEQGPLATVRLKIVVSRGDAKVEQLCGSLRPVVGTHEQFDPPNPVRMVTAPGVIVPPPDAVATSWPQEVVPTPTRVMRRRGENGLSVTTDSNAAVEPSTVGLNCTWNATLSPGASVAGRGAERMLKPPDAPLRL
jgi:hypothetical protein